MTPVDQTCFRTTVGPGGEVEITPDVGNCMQACYASILDLPLDEVPHFAAIPGDNGEWWDALLDFLAGRGFDLAVHDDPQPGLGLCSGPSPRGPFDHLVVVDGAEIIHDPHPSRAGLADGERRYWYLLGRNDRGLT